MARDTQLPGAFLFLDESGDPGTSAQSTPVFVIAILHLKSADALERAVSRARKKFLRARRPRNEVKWSNSNPEIKSAVFDQILREVDQIAGVSACLMEKKWMNPKFSGNAVDVRYNFAVRVALEQSNLFDPSAAGRPVTLTIDLRSRQSAQRLERYLQALQEPPAVPRPVEPRDSIRCAQLQAADFIAGAIYTAYAQRDWRYLNLLKKKRIEIRLRHLKPKNKSQPPGASRVPASTDEVTQDLRWPD